MRTLTVCLPTVMLAGLTVLLATQAPGRTEGNNPPATATERSRLEQERKAIASRLKELSANRRLVVPRGGL